MSNTANKEINFMKKIFYVMPLLAMALTACDPSEIDGAGEWAQFDINQLQATATPVQVDGKNGNVIHVASNSPVVTAWDADQLVESTTHTVTTEGNIYVTKLGTNNIRVMATNNGGAPAVKEISVQIDTISYITDAIKNRLCIGQSGAPTYFRATASPSQRTPTRLSVLSDGVAAKSRQTSVRL